jgi:hypothetical protein
MLGNRGRDNNKGSFVVRLEGEGCSFGSGGGGPSDAILSGKVVE